MNRSSYSNEDLVNIIEDRVGGIFNDLKAFVYIRNEKLQHNKGKNKDNIGGGNMAMAISLFACLSLLAKAYYVTENPDHFRNSFNNGRDPNETDSFIHFVRFIQDLDIDLGLTSNGEDLKVVWNGFRNWLAHRAVVQPGKQTINFNFKTRSKKTIKDRLKYAKKYKAFECDDSNWRVNCDVLLAYLPDILKLTSDHVNNSNVDNALLFKVVWGR